MMTYNELLAKYNSSSDIPYSELLLSKEWNIKRNQILNRDGKLCLMCGKTETQYIEGLGSIWLHIEEKTETGLIKDDHRFFEGIIKSELIYHENSDRPYHLHVHHKYYILRNLPWNYPDETLMTLCNWCHWKFHEENRVPVYESSEMLKNLDYRPCIRCNGAGWFPEFQQCS